MVNKKIMIRGLAVFAGLSLMLTLTASRILAQDAPVPKTGQTTSYATGDDGYYEAGVAWPVPRFTDNGDGTVTDNLTGLMWEQDTDATKKNWSQALIYCENLSLGQNGCSEYSDWRLPNYRELFSLVDAKSYSPALPSGHPFTNAQSFHYWSSTTYVTLTDSAWSVNFSGGIVSYYGKYNLYYVRAVRGGQ